MQNSKLDNKLFIKLPEGVSVNLLPAGIAIRTCAYLYDFAIRLALMLILSLCFKFLGTAGEGLILISFFLISWGYYIIFEAKTGTTPGKKKFHLQVIQDNGLPASLSQIITRNLLRPADAFPFAYCLGIFTMAFNKHFKRIGDWASGTMVVHVKVANKEYDFTEQQAYVPQFQLSTEEQQVVIAFAERAPELSEPRQAELANILQKQLAEKDVHAAEKLKKMARFYIGQGI